MATIRFKIPYEFISARATLSWTDILYGLEHSLVAPEVAVQHADNIIKDARDPQPEEIEIAGLSKADPVLDLVSILSSREDNKDAEAMRDKWLFLVLAWVYENKDGLTDPLAIAEDVYSDFDYPRSIASFVRYMPMQGPDLGSLDMNTARLFDNWRDYLEISGKQFAPFTSLRQ
jgi:hypothetical protein